ncbi:polysaccharide deacetylase family protein [Roseisalinus antarcticus]|uniref:Chitooligosaccharide deacetylase n=1 Tax=Roseisalinus antarcticus TaxID=254357 RepID=A0A1Y5U1C0_9RHOB|nr:polysaccharide deacetylase family protein [Roseisalinus antarcticus]SLN74347.1 Polysaccharide deacetylase [Roseisalinus antarcticus]
MIEAVRHSLAAGAALRVVNYHNTPAVRAAQFDADFAALAERYGPVTEDMLADYLATGAWPGGRPGVIPAFYNGYRNNFDVARPLLEKHGLIGWFFAVPGFTHCPIPDQAAFAARRTIRLVPDEYADGRAALSWDEMQQMDEGGHVIASHTRTHTRVELDDSDALWPEIVGAQDEFAARLGHPVRSFAWLFGGRYGETELADRAVDAAGYEFLFSNLAVQRLPGVGQAE